ncbi:MAG: hypothetical protein EOP07_19740, partial [Proteobacteria bacterium]
MKTSKTRKIIGITVGIILTPFLLLFLALVVINVVDWDKHRPFVKSMVERFTDFEVENIEGIRVHLLTSAEAGVDRIKIKQTNETSGLKSFQSEQAYLKIKVFPLLKKQLIIQSFVLDGARIKLGEGKPDPKSPKNEEEGMTLADLPQIFINSASIADFNLTYKGDKKKSTPFDLTIVHAGVTAPSNEKPAMLSSEGKANDLPFEILGAFGSFDAFRDQSAAYPARITAKIADHSLEVRGALKFANGDADFDVDASGPGLKQLKQALKLNIGDIPQYTLSFGVHKKPETIRFEEIKLLLGKSSVVGNGGLDFRNNRTLIQADLQSPKLYAADFKGLVKTDKNNKEPDEVPKAPGQYFSNEPIDASALKAVDADISIAVKDFDGQKAGAAIDNVVGRIQLNRGKLV